MPSLLRRRPSPSMVVALIALFIALDGPATAAKFINGRLIKANTVTSKQIRNRTIGTQDLSRRAMRTLRATPAGSITGKELAAKSVDAAKLADNAVGSSAIADKGVGAADLADSSIGPMQLAPNAVTSSKLADSSVGSAAIADGTLQARDVGDFYGAASVTFRDFNPADETVCQTSQPFDPTPSAPGKPANIADDVITVTPPVGWPDQLTVEANPGAGNKLRIIVCNPTNNPIAVPDSNTVPPIFRYLAIDLP